MSDLRTPFNRPGSLGGTMNDFLAQELTFRPAFNNLFEIRVTPGTAGRSGTQTPTSPPPDFLGNVDEQYPRFYCTSFNFIGDNFNTTRDLNTHLQKVQTGGGYERNNQITVNWRENENYDVHRLHQAWIRAFYNRGSSRYISGGLEVKFRNMEIYLEAPVINGQTLDTTARLVLYHMVPQKLPDMTLAWNSSDAIEYSISYNYHWWWFQFVDRPPAADRSSGRSLVPGSDLELTQ